MPRLILLSLLLLSGCVAKKTSPGDNSFEKYIVDIDSVQELALDEVNASNNYFTISADKHTEVVQRFWYFADNHNKAKPVFNKKTKTITSSGDKYIYLLSWKAEQKGAKNTYKVDCKFTSGAVTPDTVINSKNLARFLNEGTLEVSLLK